MVRPPRFQDHPPRPSRQRSPGATRSGGAAGGEGRQSTSSKPVIVAAVIAFQCSTRQCHAQRSQPETGLETPLDRPSPCRASSTSRSSRISRDTAAGPAGPARERPRWEVSARPCVGRVDASLRTLSCRPSAALRVARPPNIHQPRRRPGPPTTRHRRTRPRRPRTRHPLHRRPRHQNPPTQPHRQHQLRSQLQAVSSRRSRPTQNRCRRGRSAG